MVNTYRRLLKFIFKIEGSDKICLVNDSMMVTGMLEGEYIFGSLKDGRKVIVKDVGAKLIDRSAFVGSIATSNRFLKTMVDLVDVKNLWKFFLSQKII